MKRTRMKNLRRRLGMFAMVCALFLTLLASGMVPVADARITQSDIDKLEKESDKLADKKKELENQLAKLSKDKKAALQRKTLLDQRIDVVAEEITNTEQLIENYRLLITQREEELAAESGVGVYCGKLW